MEINPRLWDEHLDLFVTTLLALITVVVTGRLGYLFRAITVGYCIATIGYAILLNVEHIFVGVSLLLLVSHYRGGISLSL